MQSTSLVPGVALLCSSGAPIVCEGGSCCDIDPDCSTICTGG